jgi:GDPmannose 4,6-dehydratase
VQDDQFYRPAEVNALIGDSSKARAELGWQPDFDFRALIQDMVRSDLANITTANAKSASRATQAP